MIVRRGLGQTEVPPGCTETADGNVVCSGPSGPTGGGTGTSPVQPIYALPTPSGPVDCSNTWQFVTHTDCWKIPSLPNCNTFAGTGALGQMLCGGNAYWIWLGLAGIGVLILYNVTRR
jgi:hypothetical protein